MFDIVIYCNIFVWNVSSEKISLLFTCSRFKILFSCKLIKNNFSKVVYIIYFSAVKSELYELSSNLRGEILKKKNTKYYELQFFQWKRGKKNLSSRLVNRPESNIWRKEKRVWIFKNMFHKKTPVSNTWYFF